MKIFYRLEFGHRKGTRTVTQHECIDLDTSSAARGLAAALVRVFSTHIDEGQGAAKEYWLLKGSTPRATWQSYDYYVVLTRMDGKTKFPSAREEF